MALRVCSFQGMQNLPLLVAQRRGEFAALGLDVTLSLTNSSAAQLAELATGVHDLIHTAPDNVINYDTNPATFGVDPATAPRAVMLLGGSNGPLTIYTRPSIADAAALRYQSIGVDNPTSGFALVLRDLLARLGLELARHDYQLVAAGGTGARLRGLLAGAFDATILYPPFDAEAEANGCHALIRSTSVYPAYASQALAALESWVAEHDELLTRYMTALLRALRWVYHPINRAAAAAIVAAEPALGVTPAAAANALAAFTDPLLGFGPAASLSDGGVAQVIALRAHYSSLPATALGAPDAYYDLSAYERALASL